MEIMATHRHILAISIVLPLRLVFFWCATILIDRLLMTMGGKSCQWCGMRNHRVHEAASGTLNLRPFSPSRD
ncbi:hypothetical protein C8R41DRAFT_827898 [Lentinula lateritia]|uniref:Secreted protein n=1 Tax=Lentinula lateritia TaxID=40482 RepID=A0ABQ8VIV2_9AGAR|nr:hypothetical protein C8R41DRAFT_827898 [Lentinula lateritia]